MDRTRIFIDRRRRERRQEPDPCRQLPMDLYHRKRRKSAERRAQGRSLLEHYEAFMAARGEREPEPME
ncbi:hypothetical protein ACXYTJ_04320 [Gilvimarinus sp. F26214L]|uniref:hypothetical protein n=1 Tax=Gilvimarinus sp. DZF01 TaxID=3461371 RepID=UPI0040464901